MTPVSNEPTLLDRICHKEQLGVWADELASVLALGDFLKEDWTFDDSVDLSNEIAAQLRDIIGAALTHPEFNVTEALRSQSPEPSSSEPVWDMFKIVQAAYYRGYQWGIENPNSPEYVAKAAYDYADKITSTLSPTPSQPGTGEEVERLKRTNERWRQNSIDTWAAMTTMRNSINERIPMPSLEGDLLQGPESSVFCAAVAEAVLSYVDDAEARLSAVEGALEKVESALRFEDPKAVFKSGVSVKSLLTTITGGENER